MALYGMVYSCIGMHLPVLMRREQTLHLFFVPGGGFFFLLSGAPPSILLGASPRALVGVGQGSPQPQGTRSGLEWCQ